MNNKRNSIIGVLLLLVVITIGYALFSETVTIGGTTRADGNVAFELYNNDGSDKLDIKVNGVGSNGTAKINSSRKVLNVIANFDYPTAYIEIPVKVKNTGNIDLYVSDINFGGNLMVEKNGIQDSFSLAYFLNAFPDLFTCEGIKKFDLIKAKSEKNIIIKAKWIENKEGVEKFIKSINFDLTISGMQEINDNNTGLPTSPYKYAIGDEINIGTEKFNVISENSNTVTMLAKYNLTLDGQKQDTVEHVIAFADKNFNKKPNDFFGYWTDDSGNLINNYGNKYPAKVYDKNSNTYSIVEAYVSKLKGIKNIPVNDKTTLTGRLIYLDELVKLGYSPEGEGYCENKEYVKWISNGQFWWIDSVINIGDVIKVNPDSELYPNDFYNAFGGTRPVITIDKKYLN